MKIVVVDKNKKKNRQTKRNEQRKGSKNTERRLKKGKMEKCKDLLSESLIWRAKLTANCAQHRKPTCHQPPLTDI